MSEHNRFTPLPKKPGEKKEEISESEGNVKPSDLFKNYNTSSPNPLSQPSNATNQNVIPQNQPPISLESIPIREEPPQESPGLYKGTPEQQKYFDQNIAATVTTGSEPTMGEDIFFLKKKLAEKEKEIDEIFGTFKEIKGAYEMLNVQKQNLEAQIGTIKSSLELKETQIKTLSETIKMKDEQIALKTDQVKMKEDQLQIYQKTLEDKNKEIERIKSQTVDKTILTQKDAIIAEKDKKIADLEAKIKSLEEEADLLKGDIDSADEEVEQLNQKLQKLQTEAKDATFLNRKQVIEKVKSILKDSLHNVNLTVPTIEDLAELNLYDVKPTVNLKISSDINIGNPKHVELQQEYIVFDNISLRIFEDKDRWLILKDGEQLFMAVLGAGTDKYLSFTTNDPKHIKFFNGIAMESWLRGRQVKK